MTWQLLDLEFHSAPTWDILLDELSLEALEVTWQLGELSLSAVEPEAVRTVGRVTVTEIARAVTVLADTTTPPSPPMTERLAVASRRGFM